MSNRPKLKSGCRHGQSNWAVMKCGCGEQSRIFCVACAEKKPLEAMEITAFDAIHKNCGVFDGEEKAV